MKNLSPAMQLAIGETTSTFCWCAILTRQDGTRLGFTEHDKPISVDGVLCSPTVGTSLSNIAGGADMSVDNADMLGFLDSDAITRNDLLAGVYDGAGLLVLMVDWSTSGAEYVVLARGTLGEVKVQGESYTAEFRSLTQHLQQTIGRKVGIECDVQTLGDERCKVDLGTYTHAATVETVIDIRREFTVSVPGIPADPEYFRYGTVVWSNGDGRNTQLGGVISSWADSSSTVKLLLDTPDDIQVGDTLYMSAGCDRRVETCTNRFNNFSNYQGWPHVPGRDDAAETVDAK